LFGRNGKQLGHGLAVIVHLRAMAFGIRRAVGLEVEHPRPDGLARGVFFKLQAVDLAG
jgi:hypothetical protein